MVRLWPSPSLLHWCMTQSLCSGVGAGERGVGGVYSFHLLKIARTNSVGQNWVWLPTERPDEISETTGILQQAGRLSKIKRQTSDFQSEQSEAVCVHHHGNQMPQQSHNTMTNISIRSCLVAHNGFGRTMQFQTDKLQRVCKWSLENSNSTLICTQTADGGQPSPCDTWIRSCFIE